MLDASELSWLADDEEEDVEEFIHLVDEEGNGGINHGAFNSLVESLLEDEFHWQTGGADTMTFKQALPMMAVLESQDFYSELWELKYAHEYDQDGEDWLYDEAAAWEGAEDEFLDWEYENATAAAQVSNAPAAAQVSSKTKSK